MNKERDKAQRHAQRQEEAIGDVGAARSELLERRDNLLAEFDEKLASLDRLDRALGSGEMEPRAAQAQVRKLVGEGGRASMRLAGRTRIGLSAPDTPALGKHSPPIVASAPRGQNRGSTGGSVQKVLAAMDARLVGLLTARDRPEPADETRVEIALLLQLRRSIAVHVEGLPDDPVLLASVRDYVQHAEQVLEDLAGNESQRLGRMLDFNRTMLAQLVATGGKGGDLRGQLKEARAALENQSQSTEAIREVVVGVFEKLRAQLAGLMPASSDALLDQLLAARAG